MMIGPMTPPLNPSPGNLDDCRFLLTQANQKIAFLKFEYENKIQYFQDVTQNLLTTANNHERDKRGLQMEVTRLKAELAIAQKNNIPTRVEIVAARSIPSEHVSKRRRMY